MGLAQIKSDLEEMKSGSNLERVISSGQFAVTGELGPPQGMNLELIKRKIGYLKGFVDSPTQIMYPKKNVMSRRKN